MENFKFNFLNNYASHGQNVEQSIRYTLTGKIEKADNKPFTEGADCLYYQIKSARATICKGKTARDLERHLDLDKATAYIYGAKDGTAYIMNRQTYTAFVKAFGTVTVDSAKNGGSAKIRLKHETAEMVKWLETH